MFINEQVAATDLPKIESLVFKPLQRVYLRASLIQYVIFFSVLLAGIITLLYFIPAMRMPVKIIAIFTAWLLLFLAGLWLNVKSFHSRGYAIREKDFIYKSGWLFQETSACAFNRIQHCSVSSGPIDRRFGLATLRMYTAGTEGDLAVPGLPEEEAFAIKEFITQKIVRDEPGN